MAIVAIGIESLMICAVISITHKKGGPAARHRRTDRVTGHAIPVKRLSGVTRERFNGHAIGSEFLSAPAVARSAFVRSITHGSL